MRCGRCATSLNRRIVHDCPSCPKQTVESLEPRGPDKREADRALRHVDRACMQGLEAGLQKQVLYTGLRLSLYDQLAAYTEGEVPVYKKIVYATATTGIGILAANPADVVQTKFIAHRTKPAAEIQAELRSAATRAPAAATGSPLAVGHSVDPSARPSAAQTVSGSGSSTGVRTFRTQAAPDPWQKRQCGGQPRPRGAYAHGSLLRHIYGHHLRWHGGVAPAALRGDSRNGAQPLVAFRRGAPAVRPTGSMEGSLHVARGLSENIRGLSNERPAGAASEALRQGAAKGPKTVTGVPLQNARMAYYIIIREEGLVNGLYRGFWANFACSCVQGASEIATYDVAKTAALAAGYPDSTPVHLAAGASRHWGSSSCARSGAEQGTCDAPSLHLLAMQLCVVQRSARPGMRRCSGQRAQADRRSASAPAVLLQASLRALSPLCSPTPSTSSPHASWPPRSRSCWWARARWPRSCRSGAARA